jgi:hypothetical protein
MRNAMFCTIKLQLELRTMQLATFMKMPKAYSVDEVEVGNNKLIMRMDHKT